MASTGTRLPTCYRHPDRETGLSCSECGRPICAECMTPAAVGIRCPEHAGAKRRVSAPRVVARRAPSGLPDAIVTKVLVAVNVGIYLITAVQGAGLNAPGGELFARMALYGPAVADGDWYRLITTAFLHASLLHIAFNMLALWWLGSQVEAYLGPWRFLGVYLVSGLAGSAGALVQTLGVTVGASGAIFGILGSMLIIEWQATGRLGGNAMTLIVINLGLSFALSNVSIGGHIGGLIGGILTTLAFARWGRGNAAYGRVGLAGIVGLVAVAAASIAIAYWQVRGLA